MNVCVVVQRKKEREVHTDLPLCCWFWLMVSWATTFVMLIRRRLCVVPARSMCYCSTIGMSCKHQEVSLQWAESDRQWKDFRWAVLQA